MGFLFRYSAPDSATVGVASAEALPGNESRMGATFVNDSANKIYLAFGSPAVIGKGILLTANGGSYEIHKANLTLLPVNAIASGANSELAILEAIR